MPRYLCVILFCRTAGICRHWPCFDATTSTPRCESSAVYGCLTNALIAGCRRDWQLGRPVDGRSYRVVGIQSCRVLGMPSHPYLIISLTPPYQPHASVCYLITQPFYHVPTHAHAPYQLHNNVHRRNVSVHNDIVRCAQFIRLPIISVLLPYC